MRANADLRNLLIYPRLMKSIWVVAVVLAACGGKPSDLELRRRAIKTLERGIQEKGGTAVLDVRGERGEVLVISDNECSMALLEFWAELVEHRHFILVECTGALGPLRLNVREWSSRSKPAPDQARDGGRAQVMAVAGEAIEAPDAGVSPSREPRERKPVGPARPRREVVVEREVVADDPDRFVFAAVERLESPKKAADAAVVDVKPETLDRAAIAAGIGKAEERIRACVSEARDAGESATLRFVVEVGPDGRVGSVTSDRREMYTETSDCVASAIEAAIFAETKSGARFTYPVRY